MKKIVFSIIGLVPSCILLAQPNVSSISSTVGPVGTNLVISGSGFNATPSLNTVYFGSTKASVNNAAAASLSVTVPSGAIHKAISVLDNSSGLSGYSPLIFNTSYSCGGSLSASSFSNYVAFTVNGGSERTVNLGDIDGDGRSEMVVANQGGAFVSVFRNTSTPGTLNPGSFAALVNFTVPNPYASTIMDMDGDGKLDIVTCSYSSNSVTVLRNTSVIGSISFASAVSFPTGSGPYGITTGDVDMDGKPEIITGNYTQGGISVLKNTSTVGSISFATMVNFTGGGNCHMVDIADIDGDGLKDIAVASRASVVASVYRNAGVTGTITALSLSPKVDFAATGAGGDGLAAVDIDGDGKLDLAVSGISGNNICLLRNTATAGTITAASFATAVGFNVGSTSYGLSVGDVTGDGKPDFFPCGSTTFAPLLQNVSTVGTVSLAPVVNLTSNATNGFHTATGDLDNDGKNDIIRAPLSGNDINLYRNVNGFVSATTVTNVLCSGNCNGSIILSTNAPTASVLWSNASTSFSLNALCAGVYSYSLTSGTCIATASVTLVQPLPVSLTVSATGSAICTGNSSSLTVSGSGGTGAITYSWSTGSTATLISVSPTISTVYTVIAQDANGCSTTGTIGVNVNPSPTISVNSGSICSGQSFTMVPSGANTYTYQGGSAVVSPTANTSYTVAGTSTAGCVSATPAVATVTVVNNLTVTITGTNAICAGQPLNLTAGGAASYTWNTGATTSTIAPTPTANTSYSVIGASGTCSNTAITSVTVNPLPTVSAVSSLTQICIGQSATLTANGASTYSWNAGPTTNTISISPSVTTNYTVTGTDVNGCSNTSTITQVVVNCTGLTANSLSAASFNILPNPTEGRITLNINADLQNIKVEIFSALGSVIYSSNITDHKTEIDLMNMSKGMYFVKLSNEKSSVTKKVIKE